jgi:hypothetical protein
MTRGGDDGDDDACCKHIVYSANVEFDSTNRLTTSTAITFPETDTGVKSLSL